MVKELTEGELTDYFLLMVIIAGGTWLGFVNLGDWSFWFDEPLTVSDSLHYYSTLPIGEVLHSRPLNFWITGSPFFQ